MKITILDGHALNPGDLSWKPLEQFGSVRVFDRTSSDEVIDRIGDSDAILLNKVPINENILTHCPTLKYIGVQATGYNVIDLDACRRHSVTVTNVPSYSTAGVAQLVFAFISCFANKVQLHSDSVMAGEWCTAPDFCYWKAPLTELEGKTLGIFGYGHIGQRVAKIGDAYGMHVIVHTRTPNDTVKNPVSTDDLFIQSDFLTLHAPLTPDTQCLVNDRTLRLMKKTAVVINTARGALVNERDVRTALDQNIISGYAADVLTSEPMAPNCPLLGAPHCILTPHIAWAAVETRQRLLDIVVKNLASFVAGTPQNVVS